MNNDALAPDFVPVVTDALFKACSKSPVNMPLVLVRHVAMLPSPLPSSEEAQAVAQVREYIEKLRQRQHASFTWTPSQHTGLSWMSPGTVRLHFREGTMQVWGQEGDQGKGKTLSLLLDANAVLLLQGTLNFFISFLVPLAAGNFDSTTIANHDLVLAVQVVEEKLAESPVELFAAPLSDQYGRDTILRAVWNVEQACIAWQWEFGIPHIACLDVEQATWVSGFITLVRLAYPDEWKWNEGAE